MGSQTSNFGTMHRLLFVSGAVTFVLMLALALLPVDGLPLLAVLISLLTAQIGLIAIVLFLSAAPLSRRVWVAAVYACGIYFAVFVPPALAADRFGYGALISMHAGLGILAAYAAVLAGWQWLTGVRLSSGDCRADERSTLRRPPQYGLMDLMKWVTLVSVELGIWSSVTVRFLTGRPLVPWRGMYYAYRLPDQDFVCGTAILVGGPIFVLVLMIYWIALSEGPQRQKWADRLALLWMLIGFATFAIAIPNLWPPLIALVAPPLFLLPTLVHALVMKQLGWRMTSQSSPP